MRNRLMLTLLAVLTACANKPGRSLVDCDPSEELSIGDQISAIDRDNDGSLTPSDLDPGQAVVILDWSGTRGKVGTSVHFSDQVEVVYEKKWDWDPKWSAYLWLEDCKPVLTAGLVFYGEDRVPTWLQPGEGEGGALVYASDPPVDWVEESYVSEGVVRVTDVVRSTTASLEFDGFSEMELATAVPSMRRTGQVVRVAAFVAREAAIIGEAPP